MPVPMSTKFFNNTDAPLIGKFSGIARSMANFDLFHAVVGYFRSSGYFKLRRELDHVQEICILVGINIDHIFRHHDPSLLFTPDSHTEETIKQFRQNVLDDIRHADYDNETEQGILQMFEDVASGKLQLRIHATHNLHAKFYLCLPKEHNEHSDGWVIMGSSNLTDSGLGISEPPRYELNVAMKDYDDVHYCEEEFQKLWADSVPVTAEDMKDIQGGTHIGEQEITPYELYLKVLIDSFGSLVEDDFDLDPTRYGYKDLSYQRDAVSQGYQMLMKHNGCFVADVVGLGKTPVATMIAKRFVQANGRNTRILVITPPAVRTEWEIIFKNFEIKNTWFVNNGSLDKVLKGQDNYRLPHEYDMIIVDEAHNFRNDVTKSYTQLEIICKSPRGNRGRVEGDRKKVMLLSATPLNNTPSDIRNQLLLFQDDDNSTIEGLNDIWGTFSIWIQQYKHIMHDRDILPREQFLHQINHIYDHIRHQVLQPVMVRRTRNNILNEPRYRQDLAKQNVTFPKIAPLRDHRYYMTPALTDLFARTIDLLTDTRTEDNPTGKGLHYARYRAVEFFRSGILYKGRSGSHIAKLLTGIFRTHLVKRLESSFSAFKKSLHTFLTITEGMIEMFNNDKVLIAPDYNVKELQQDKSLDEIIQYIEEKGENQEDFVYATDDFRDEFLPMLLHDKKLLVKLCKEWDDVVDDPKLDTFIALLQMEIFNPAINEEGKLVIFSESVDTVEYLKAELTKRLHRRDILAVSAKNRNRLRLTIEQNFDANSKNGFLDNYNIIITSDALAEGVNLHRANIIVSYDSPWNASRLMQRNGRVNRIGTKADTIYNYMFYPSVEGDTQINLYNNALIKLQSFHSALGEDSQIFSHEEIVRDFKLYDANVRDETDRSLEYFREVQQVYDQQRALYDRIKNLPPKSRVVRSADGKVPPPTSIAFLSSPVKTDYILVDPLDRPQAITFLEAADLLRADPKERPLPFDSVRETHFRQLQRALALYHERILQQSDAASLRLTHRDKATIDAHSFIRKLYATAPDDDWRELCARILKNLEVVRLRAMLKAINDLAKIQKGKNPMTLEQLYDQLFDIADTYCPDTLTVTPNLTNVQPDIIVSETFI